VSACQARWQREADATHTLVAPRLVMPGASGLPWRAGVAPQGEPHHPPDLFAGMPQTAPATRVQERPAPVAQGLHRFAGIAQRQGAQTVGRKAVTGRAAPGDLQPDSGERTQAAQAPSSQRARAAPPVSHPAP
jgi:hypothetical protein